MDATTAAASPARVRRPIIRVGLAGTLLLAGLLWLATVRFPVTMVDPPQPTPDYGTQTAWSLIGAVLVLGVAVVTAVVAWRRPERAARIGAVGLTAMLISGIGCAAIAIIASTP